jgi:hypothetical protein
MPQKSGRRHDWPTILAEFRSSGLTQAEFCRRRSLPLDSFRYQLYRVGRPAVRPALSRFLPVRLVPETPDPPSADRLVLILAGDRRLAVAPGFDADTLARLLDLLEHHS